jgi:hypothetical protein
MGYEAAGVVDELGEGIADVAVGDRVFGLSAEGAAQAELAVLSYYAPTSTFARWEPSPSPTARGSPGGYARSRPTASTSRSTSPGAVYSPSSSSSPAAPGTSSRSPTSAAPRSTG